MISLEEMKKVADARAISRPLEAKEIPVGMSIVSDDGNNRAMIVSVCGGKKVFLGGPVVVDGKETLEITPVEMKKNWLLETPNGPVVCAVPDDSGIITPGQAENPQGNNGFAKLEI